MQACNSLFRGVHQVQSVLVDLLFPPRCVSCNAYGAFLCAACAQLVEPVGLLLCESCGRPQQKVVALCDQCRQLPTRVMTAVRIAALHTSPLREAIHALKYERRVELAEALARYLVAFVQSLPQQTHFLAVDGVVPVPLSQERHRERGYNQAELLASAFCHSVQLPLRAAWLTRRRSTRSQVGLTATERQTNVQDAFVATTAVAGKRILLIDDVYTTGATMRACAQAVLHAGAQTVYGLALACPR